MRLDRMGFGWDRSWIESNAIRLGSARTRMDRIGWGLTGRGWGGAGSAGKEHASHRLPRPP
eukprot:3276791-Rhodomonas_salina.1